jgi:N-acetylmuramoyl-L-alanine amidase
VRTCGLALAVALTLFTVFAGAAHGALRRTKVGTGLTAVLAGEKLYLEVEPRAGESVVALARRVSDAKDSATQFAKANGGVRRLRADLDYRVPFAMLNPPLQVATLQAIFSRDRVDAQGWRHTTRGESLWSIAEWFTGNGKQFAAIRKANRLRDDPAPGTALLIPRALLAPRLLAASNASGAPRSVAEIAGGATPAPGRNAGPTPRAAGASPATKPGAPAVPLPPMTVPAEPLDTVAVVAPLVAEPFANGAAAAQRAALPAAPPKASVRAAPEAEAPAVASDAPREPSAPTTASPYRLAFGKDAEGEYAVYELRPGEALYSSVVVRFTGRTLADDVNALAQDVAKRSGIADVTSIAIGYPVKIPLDLVQPEFLPPGNPRRVEYEAALSASSKFRNQVTAVDLEGITVVLDAGHGGIDTGASIGGVWESTYVYDIALRVKNLLESYTAAQVVATTRDGDRFRVEDRDVLSYSRARAVLTSPAYPIQDSKIGVNLRWYIANSVQRTALKSGRDSERVVFVSIHADSLHPSLRGSMVYIPDASLSGDAFERSGPEYASRREVREAPSADQSRRDRQRSEGLSRELASYVVRAIKSEGLPVDPFKAVRERVIRNRHEWVPAVLRYNTVPAKVLIEVCNLGNVDDRAAIQTRAFRQQMAEAIVQGIRSYYGKSGTAPASGQIAKAAARR